MGRNLKSYVQCDYKIRYPDVRAAIAAADSYMDRITLTSSSMRPYYCRFHSYWHIGHNRTNDTYHDADYQKRCVSRQHLRRRIQRLTRTLIRIENELKIAA